MAPIISTDILSRKYNNRQSQPRILNNFQSSFAQCIIHLTTKYLTVEIIHFYQEDSLI